MSLTMRMEISCYDEETRISLGKLQTNEYKYDINALTDLEFFGESKTQNEKFFKDGVETAIDFLCTIVRQSKIRQDMTLQKAIKKLEKTITELGIR